MGAVCLLCTGTISRNDSNGSPVEEGSPVESEELVERFSLPQTPESVGPRRVLLTRLPPPSLVERSSAAAPLLESSSPVVVPTVSISISSRRPKKAEGTAR